MTDQTISPAAVIGAVSLTVSDLDRSLTFYQNRLGLTLLERSAASARLGAGEAALLHLTEVKGARKPPRTTGLYHFAVLLPSRYELAQALRRLAETETSLQGGADHGVSEALYLADPDGTGIELYADRAQDEWPRDEDGQLDMGTDALDVDGLVDLLEVDPRPWAGMPAGTRVGHVHLQVSNLARAEVFYTGVLGFKLMQRYGSAAAFLSAGGYHHHIGINTWAGAGAPPPPTGSAGLRWFEVVLPSPAEVQAAAARLQAAGINAEALDGGLLVKDPSENGVLLRAA